VPLFLQLSIHHRRGISITGCDHWFSEFRDDASSSGQQKGFEMKRFAQLIKDESGATAIEYGLIAAATGLALVSVMPTIRTALEGTFQQIAGALH
jgi:pilus assembly protein Flp/PilA